MKRTPIWLFLLIVSLTMMTGCASVLATTPSDDGVIEIMMRDYKFEPEIIRVQAGDTVRIVLHNEGNKMHELMIGRNVNIHDGQTEGFAEDFFAGITPTITGPGMVMGMEGMDMEMEGMDMGEDEHAEESMDDMADMGMADEHDEGAMDNMADMGEDEHTDDMEMADEHDEDAMSGDDHDDEDMAMAEDEHDEEGEHDEEEHDDEAMPAGEFGPFQMPEMDAHEGLMVMIDPPSVAPGGEPTIIEFTVPEDKVGTWTFACFQERGQHFDDGMEGTLIVEP